MMQLKDIFEPSPDEAVESAKKLSPITKLILEIAPLAVFYITNIKGDWLIKNVSLFHSFDKPIFPATALFIVTIFICLLVSFILTKRLPVMPVVSAVFVFIFGSLTLWFHNPDFIKIKPTLLNSLFALMLFIGLYFRKSLLAYIFEGALHLDSEGWRKLTLRWAFFFVFLAAANEIVWRNFSTLAWTNFKIFFVSPITIIFFLCQLPLIMRHNAQDIRKL